MNTRWNDAQAILNQALNDRLGPESSEMLGLKSLGVLEMTLIPGAGEAPSVVEALVEVYGPDDSCLVGYGPCVHERRPRQQVRCEAVPSRALSEIGVEEVRLGAGDLGDQWDVRACGVALEDAVDDMTDLAEAIRGEIAAAGRALAAMEPCATNARAVGAAREAVTDPAPMA